MSFLSVFIASLLGSAHCVGMCGGLVTFYAGRSESKAATHITYHFGRLLTYSALGTAAGFVGGTFNRAGELLGFQRASALLTGVLLIYWGLRELSGSRRGSAGAAPQAFAFQTILRVLQLRPLQGTNAAWPLKAGLLGACSTFLPCGWLYSFVAVAAATADPLRGCLVMLAFWCGTVPLLGGFGAVVRALGRSVQPRLPRLTACLLILAGTYSLFGRYDKLFFSIDEVKGHSDCRCHEGN